MSKIIFMGTPDFAVPALQSLLDKAHDIALVVTQPDRPSGRGQKLTPPPVKALAELNDIQVLQPGSLRKDLEARNQILSTPCDFVVVVAFGQILPQEILAHPKMAPLNIHASILPAYRGAAPIARAIMEGDETSGVSIQWMTEELDMGDILFQTPCAITEEDTAASLHDKLKIAGANALNSCLQLFEDGRVKRVRQDPRVGSYASKLTKEEAKISFDQSAFAVHRTIMGLNPWPVAECQVLGKRMRIFRSKLTTRSTTAEPGTIVDTSDGEIIVACEHSCIALTEVQMENKKRVSSADFLRGHPLPEGLILGSKG